MTILKKIKIISKTLFLRIIGRTRKPIFIVGTGRCGSTLLVDILMTNKAIQIDKNEQYDWFLLALKDGKTQNPMLTDIINYKLTAYESVKKWTLFYKFKLKIILENKINSTNKIFILKSPAITFILKEINTMFPQAKYIHLYRNGYAVANSWCKKEYMRVKQYNEYYTQDEFLKLCAHYYNDSILEINTFLKTLEPHNYLNIAYENLSENPQNELNHLLNFLKIDEKCTYDLSRVKSTNYKIASLKPDQKKELYDIMKESLKLLDYNN